MASASSKEFLTFRQTRVWIHSETRTWHDNNIQSLYQLIKFHCLITFTSWDIGQYVYYNCLFTWLWRHKIWNYPNLSNQAVLLHDQIIKTKTLVSSERKELLRWNKKNHFSSFLNGFQLPKIVSDLRVRF